MISIHEIFPIREGFEPSKRIRHKRNILIIEGTLYAFEKEALS